MKDLPAVTTGGALMSPEDLKNMRDIASIFVEAGMFEVSTGERDKGVTEAKKQAIATVQILAGQEMGLTPFQAMKGLHVVKGKVTPGYQTLGSMVKSSPRHDYKVLQFDSDAARIEFLKDGKSLGVSSFTTEDMQKAGLGGANWQKYKRNMLFSKAMSTGVNTFCPEVTMGPVYTPEDFGATENEAGELLIEEEKPEKKKRSTQSKKNSTSAKSGDSKEKVEPSSKPELDPAPEFNEELKNKAKPEPEAQDAELVEEEAKGEIHPEIIDQILQAGIGNGWTEEQAEAWTLDHFKSKGIDIEVESVDEIIDQLSWPVAEEAINHMINNKPAKG